MPNRSERAKERKFRKTPGGNLRIEYFKGKPSKHTCANCGKILHGVPHGKTSSEKKKLAKTKKRPERVFGGVLCGKCSEIVLSEGIKVRIGAKNLNEVELNLKQFVEQAQKIIE